MALAPAKLQQTPPTATLSKAGADSSSKAASASLGLAEDFDNFLTLLTTQLKYQDPTAPMDSNQFTQQLVSFTGVEQQINANKNLEKLINLQSGGQFNGMLGYIGKEIEAEGNSMAMVDGYAKMSFDLAGAPNSLTIDIKDAGGKVVASQKIQGKSGSNVVYWDGTTSNGGKLTSGEYTYTVTAKNAAGNDLAVKTYTAGRVTGVLSDENGGVLTIGDMKVPVTKVVAVREPDEKSTSTTKS